MNREEAVATLKEIINGCRYLSLDAMTLDSSKTEEQSVNYRIRIKGALDRADKEAISDIIKQRDLVMEENQTEIVIYKPK